MTPDQIPDYAEEVSYGLIFKIGEQPSQFVPGHNCVTRFIECPCCQSTYPDPGANKAVHCRCGLSMKFHNNGAAIWRAPKLEVVS